VSVQERKGLPRHLPMVADERLPLCWVARFNVDHPARPMAREDLPQEVVLAIQRILEIQSNDDGDPFDGFSDEFSTAGILNQFFPDGGSLQFVKRRGLY
jgi:hypothetical protein